MAKTHEQLLIEAYKQLDELRNKIEEAINLLGMQKIDAQEKEELPIEVKKLVEVAITLTPEQREHLMLFLNSIKQS